MIPTATSRGRTTPERAYSFGYDHRNRLIEKSSPLGKVTYTYDGVGNLKSKTDAGGTVSYEYDEVNQLRTINDHGALVTYDPRDENNRSHKVTYPGGDMTISRDWDFGGRIKSILAKSSAGTIADLKYEYEPGSNLLHTFTDSDGTIAEYSYYLLNQLTGEIRRTADGRSVGQTIWTYDDNNNRASQTVVGVHGTTTYYDYDDADQLLGNTYDLDGNLTNRRDGLVLDYDPADRTVAITPPPSGGGVAAKQTLMYAGLDQTQRTYVRIGKAPGTIFTYDATGTGPSSERAAVKDATPDYITRTPGGGLVSLHRGDHTYYYVTDRLGSVRVLAELGDEGIGAYIKSRYRYGPWGEILAQTEWVPQPFKFAGAEYDASTALYKMGARYYDPAVGRFTQTDPIGGGYAYAANDPINLIDPTGYDPVDPFAFPPDRGVLDPPDLTPPKRFDLDKQGPQPIDIGLPSLSLKWQLDARMKIVEKMDEMDKDAQTAVGLNSAPTPYDPLGSGSSVYDGNGKFRYTDWIENKF
jgi:RHS repeat-associated protein